MWPASPNILHTSAVLVLHTSHFFIKLCALLILCLCRLLCMCTLALLQHYFSFSVHFKETVRCFTALPKPVPTVTQSTLVVCAHLTRITTTLHDWLTYSCVCCQWLCCPFEPAEVCWYRQSSAYCSNLSLNLTGGKDGPKTLTRPTVSLTCALFQYCVITQQYRLPAFA